MDDRSFEVFIKQKVVSVDHPLRIRTSHNELLISQHKPRSQYSPTKPPSQMQTAAESKATHVAPFRHGLWLMWHGDTVR